MNINIRLSTAACFLLLTFSSVFAAGFEAGKSYARVTPRSVQEGLVCPSRIEVALAEAETVECEQML